MIAAGQVHLPEEVGVLLTYAFEDFVNAGQRPAAVLNDLVELSEVYTKPPLAVRLECEEHL
jgi:hypothetical protein